MNYETVPESQKAKKNTRKLGYGKELEMVSDLFG